MGYPSFGDYRSMPTAELENLWRLSIRPEEKRAIEQELTRRYLYTDPSGGEGKPSSAGSAAPPRPTPQAQYAPGPMPGYSHPVSPQTDYWTGSSPRPVATPTLGQRSDRELRKRSKLAIASLVLSILWIGGLGSIAGLAVGYIALKRIKKRNQRGRWLAIAGIVLSIIGLLVFVGIIARKS
jgi:uncharacterized protein DUF4190